MIKKIIFFFALFLLVWPFTEVKADLIGFNCFCWYTTDTTISTDHNCTQNPGGTSASQALCELYPQSTSPTLFCTVTSSNDSARVCDDVCSNHTPSGTKFKTCTFTGTSVASPTATTESKTEFIYPHLNVNIPTVSFSKIAEDGGMIEVNFLAEYIVGVYKYLLAIGAIFAVVWIMIAGLQYITSPGGGGAGKAKEKITSALTGLVLLMSVYLLLFIVNPDLIWFEGLGLSTIPPIVMEETEETLTGPAVSDGRAVSGSISTGVAGSNVAGNGREKKIPTSLISSVNAAATEISGLGLTFYVTDAFRTYDEQAKIISEHCQNPIGSSSCNPRSDKSPACMLVGNNPENCPHTSGKAIDVWALGRLNDTACITTVKECLANLSACKANPCISATKTAMANQGFCVLNSEPWHFEKPKKSSSCN